MPDREFLSQTCMIMAIAEGLHGAIVNSLDKRMMASILAAEALAGKDEYCSAHLRAYRGKKFEL